MRRAIPGLLALCVGASLLPAQAQEFEPAPFKDRAVRRELPQRIDDWRAEHGESWHVRQDPATGFSRMLFGGSTEPVLLPQGEADWFTAARHAVAQSVDLHGVNPASLVEERVKMMPLSLAGTTDKVAIEFRQQIQGVPVVNGWMNVIAAMDGSILAIDNTGMPELETFDVTPTVSAETATASVERWFRQDAGSPATFIGDATLVIDQVDRGGARVPVLTWEIEAQRLEQGIEPAGWIYRVNAKTGSLANRETTVHHFDVSGTVSSMATPGVLPDHGGNPPTQIPMPNLRVTSPQGNAVTDVNGNFTIVGATAPVTVTVTYDGPYHVANNQAQTDYTQNVNLTQPTGNTILMNGIPNALTTPEANSINWVSQAREWIKFIDPTDNTPDFAATSNLNLPSSCNAFFNGSSINFYPNAGGCVNTAYSTVVVHELGHWYQVLYGTGNGSDGMGEGGADIWAMYVADVGIVGQDFFGQGGGDIRNGNNLSQYWGDGNSCNLGGVHNCGQVFMGAMWKMMVNLKATHGSTMGRVIASSLYIGWQNGFNQTTIREIIVEQLMTLDDNDGNINNGTPNSNDINSAFQIQGFNGFTPDYLTFQNVTALPNTQDQSGPYTVDADIIPNVNPSVTSANLMVSVDGGPFLPVAMSNTGGNTWSGDIAGQSCVTRVNYYVEAQDSGANTDVFPDGGAAASLSFLVGDVQVVAATDFEINNAGFTVGAPGDTATTGIWERGDPVGTIAQPEDDNTPGGVNCWFTGQQPVGGTTGTNDVDNGSTTLVSPVYDLSASGDALVSYWRWYSNGENGAQDDVFLVQVTNDGASWVTAETVGPQGPGTSGGWIQHSFVLSNFVTTSANVQVRFVATDNSPGSFVEAAIDDFEISSVGTDCGGASTYCQGKLNSNFCLPFLTTVNSASVSSTLPFRITGNDIIPDETGFLIYSINGRSNLNFHNGTLCVKAPFVRLLPPKNSGNTAGGLCPGELRVNFNNRIQSGVDTSLTVGQQVNAQFFYRDPGVDFFNDGLTDGVEFTIQP